MESTHINEEIIMTTETQLEGKTNWLANSNPLYIIDNLPPENQKKFYEYKNHYTLTTETAFLYIQTCHNCDTPLDIFAGEYCSGGCFNHVEELGNPCFRGDSCAICTKSVCLKEINDFYETHYNGKHACAFIEGVIRRPDVDECRISKWKLLKSYSAKANIPEYEALEYIENCHCCGETLSLNKDEGIYCSYTCETAIEKDGYCCYFNDNNNNNNCLICNTAMRPKTPNIPPIVKRIKKFYYLSGYNFMTGYNFMINNNSRREGVKTFESADLYRIRYNITLQEAFIAIVSHVDPYDNEYENEYEEQHKCHTCRKDVVPQTFGPSHQFCSAKCEVIYDEKPYTDYCPRCRGQRAICPLCDGETFYLYNKIKKKESALKEHEPILVTIHALKHLMVYNQLDDCLFDLKEYIE